VLGLDPAEIEPDRPLAELGVDSIVAAQLATALADTLGVTVLPSEIYDHGTVAGLQRHLDGSPPVAVPRASEPAEAIPIAEHRTPDGAAESGGDSDIAVIGIACRFPGAADREDFWRNVVGGVCSITEVPAERWDWHPHFAATRGDGHIVSRWGGFLDGHDLFDPEPFRITHGEARAMSPQQRLFLETAWHALEDAGYGRAELAGTKCGVFVGVAPDGWGGRRTDARSSLGDSNAILSARLAYALDLKGSCLPIDTACSSSLVAVHLAARSLIGGDNTMALAGGVSVLMSGPRLHAFLSDSGMASPTGLCRTFDASADGFVPGEGVGVVALKRLDRARADGDHIYAVIKASGVNQDGTTSGITAPSGPAQTELERDRDEAWRPDRGQCPGPRLSCRHLRHRVLPHRLGQEQHRSYLGRGGHCRVHQGGAGGWPRHRATQSSLRHRQSRNQFRLEPIPRRDRRRTVAGPRRTPAARGGQLVRLQRHQRACRAGGAATEIGAAATSRPASDSGVGQDGRGAGPAPDGPLPVRRGGQISVSVARLDCHRRANPFRTPWRDLRRGFRPVG
jgi:3-oxoacyl-(acyl-carrier-protein) synthase/acyl carrier protein